MGYVKKSRSRKTFGHLSTGQVSIIRASFRPLSRDTTNWADEVKHWVAQYGLSRELVEEIAASSHGQT